MLNLDTTIMLRLILSFTFGGGWIAFITFIAEKSGSGKGGFLGGLPSISAISFFFISVNQSSAVAFKATTVFPLSFSITCAFLLCYAALASKKFGFVAAYSISIAIWFGLVTLVILSNLQNFLVSISLCLIISAVVYVLFRLLKISNAPGQKVKRTAREYFARVLAGGSVVAAAVLLSYLGGPIFGGAASAFPAIFSSTLGIGYKSRGMDFSKTLTRSLMISGMMSIIPYSVAIRYFFPLIGVDAGLLVSFLVILPFAVISYYIVNKPGAISKKFKFGRYAEVP